MKTLLALLLALFSLTAMAVEPRFGPEFEFTNDEMMSTGRASGSKGHRLEAKAASALTRELLRLCHESWCRAERVEGKWDQEYRFHMAGTWFQVSWDPACIEVIMKPMTIPQMKWIGPLIQKYVFDTATRLGFRPATEKHGHVNLGAREVFEYDPELFLRYYVDHANHPEWDLGLFGFDLLNAPPLALLDVEQQNALDEIIEEFNEGRYRTYQEIAIQIQNRVHRKTLQLRWRGYHYQALGLKSIAGKVFLWKRGAPAPADRQRVESRGVRGQGSFASFVLYAEFVKARLGLLESERGQPIRFIRRPQEGYSVEELAESAIVTFNETGLNARAFSPLFSPDVQASLAIRDGKLRCEDLFTL